ncbi:MAG: 2-dehydropantoate 2-reductase N-terminal domain-containing protein [Alphaproteobacteria bacterium]
MAEKSVAVLAAGANGSCIAADLIDAGLDVTVIDQWPAHVEAMRRDGLTIRTKAGARTVAVDAHHLADVCALDRRFDLVLLASKAYDAEWLATFIRPYLAADGLLVGVQNGMTAETLARVVGPERTVGCVVELSSQMFEPACVTRNTVREKTWFGVGALDDAGAPRVEEAAAALGHAGRVEIVADVLSAKWMKLVVNAMTMGLKAVLDATNADVPGLAGLRGLFLRAGEEALAAGQVLGYRPVPIFGLSADAVDGTNDLLETLLDKLTRDVGPTAINTVLQDLRKGRLSEVDLINGLVADTLAARGLAAPVNAAVVDMARRIHRGAAAPGAGNLEAVKRMAGATA